MSLAARIQKKLLSMKPGGIIYLTRKEYNFMMKTALDEVQCSRCKLKSVSHNILAATCTNPDCVMRLNSQRDPLLVEREKTHGSFENNANAWMDIREALRKHATGNENNRQQLALEMISLKLARLLQTPNTKDHWDDIAGYAKLGAEACD